MTTDKTPLPNLYLQHRVKQMMLAHPEHFDMGTYLNTEQCFACVAGWGYALATTPTNPIREEEILACLKEADGRDRKEPNGFFAGKAAAALGLSFDDARNIFFTSQWPGNASEDYWHLHREGCVKDAAIIAIERMDATFNAILNRLGFPAMPTAEDMDTMLRGYYNAALHTTSNKKDEPLHWFYDFSDWPDEDKNQTQEELWKFLLSYVDGVPNYARLHRGWLLAHSPHDIYTTAGQYLWYTRNGHGVGFWDEEYWDKENGDALTKASKALGERDAYVVNDDVFVS